MKKLAPVAHPYWLSLRARSGYLARGIFISVEWLERRR
jgi:hypothetical protein